MGVHLLIDFYTDGRQDRHEELVSSVRRNLANPAVIAVYNLGADEHRPPCDVVAHPKYRAHPMNRRLTFHDAFSFANAFLCGAFVGICNLDISLDPRSDWATAEDIVRKENIVLCQSRTELASDGSVFLDPTFQRLAYANAQDAWFWIAPFSVPGSNFELGTLGCDNAVADRIRRAGRTPVNFGSRFKINHLDLCRGKSGANTNTIHRQEATTRDVMYSRYPEREGYFLMPDFDAVASLDQVTAALGLSPLQKYQLICETMTRFIKINN